MRRRVALVRRPGVGNVDADSTGRAWCLLSPMAVGIRVTLAGSNSGTIRDGNDTGK